MPALSDRSAAWRRLRQAEGRRATIIDLYELVGRHCRLAADELPLSELISLTRLVMPDHGVWLADGTRSRWR